MLSFSRLLSRARLFCDPSGPPGSSVHGIPRQEHRSECHSLLQGSSRPRDPTQVSCVGRRILDHRDTREALRSASWLLPSFWFRLKSRLRGLFRSRLIRTRRLSLWARCRPPLCLIPVVPLCFLRPFSCLGLHCVSVSFPPH